MVIVEIGEQTRYCLEGGIIEIPRHNTRVFERDGSPTEAFKDWMRVNFGQYAKSPVSYTVHNMGWCLLPFLRNVRSHETILVRHPEKLMLLKLTWS